MTRATDMERIDARLPPQQKKLIEQAAELAGLSVASFVVSSAIQQAQVVIEQHTRTTLSLENARRLTRLLEEDAPTPALLAAAKRHKARRAQR
jgi:uncharacterized protein (DUF1778 family)